MPNNQWESSKGISRKFLAHRVIQKDDFSIEVDQDQYIRKHVKLIEIAEKRRNLPDSEKVPSNAR